MKRLGEIKVGKRLSDDEMKRINGRAGGELTGARCHNSQCYCDLFFTDGNYTLCDEPCPSSFCSSMEMSC